MRQPEIGKTISELRKQKGMTQEDLGDARELNVRSIQRLENGEVEPRASTLKLLSAALEYKFKPGSANDREYNLKETILILSVHLSCIIPLVIYPLIIWIWKKDELPLLAEQAKLAINFQLSMALYLFCSSMLISILIGLPITIALGVYTFFISIINAIRAVTEQKATYPLTLSVLSEIMRRRFFMKSAAKLYFFIYFFFATAVFTFPGAQDRIASGGETAPGDSTSIRILVDPRIELMSVVFQLAGHSEYNKGAIPSYTRAVDAHFAPFKKHAAVKRAGWLRLLRGISYNAPMSLAVYLTPPPELNERVALEPLPRRIDSRWSPGAARGFLAELRSFARDTRFMDFFADHSALYQTSVERLEKLIGEARILDWFDDFFGQSDGADFIIVLGLLTGGHCYGASAHAAKKPRGHNAFEEIYSILGVWSVDEAGLPQFGEKACDIIVHEFAHSYINPLVDAHAAALKPAGKKLFSLVESRMRPQAYGTWQTVMYESLVRACEVSYLLALSGPEAAERKSADNRVRGFVWTGALAKLFGEYEKNRVTYPTFDYFMPRIADFFDAYVRNGQAAADIAALDKETRK
ncbi:MAG TPA: DUF4932 domain-containing protein [Desulfobacteraceae bacterium]|nr:DUF4932 domain-containing protein [Desulfobacteraceae bacterium]